MDNFLAASNFYLILDRLESLLHLKINFWDLILLNNRLEDHFLLKINQNLVFLEIFNEGESGNKKLWKILFLCLRKFEFLTKIKIDSISSDYSFFTNKRLALIHTAMVLQRFFVNSQLFKRKEYVFDILIKYF